MQRIWQIRYRILMETDRTKHTESRIFFKCVKLIMFEIPQRRQNYSKMIGVICDFFFQFDFAVCCLTVHIVLYFVYIVLSLVGWHVDFFANMRVSSRACLTLSTRICLRYKFGLTGDCFKCQKRQTAVESVREAKKK